MTEAINYSSARRHNNHSNTDLMTTPEEVDESDKKLSSVSQLSVKINQKSTEAKGSEIRAPSDANYKLVQPGQMV